ncbi:MAG: DNA-processing protein DprA [Desulfohalobiaceae bacterium]
MFGIPEQDPGFKEEFWSCLALTHCPGLGLLTRNRLLRTYGSAYQAVQNLGSWNELSFMRFSLVRNFQDELWREGAWQEWVQCQQQGLGVVLYTSSLYPACLQEIPDAPLYLYFRGQSQLLQQPCLAVVGARNCTNQGARLVYQLSSELSQTGICVVSGFAQGIDSQAHKGGLQGPGGSIAVLGTGLDQSYPAGNRELQHRMQKNGLLLTEFAPGTQPEAHNFPRRNRIISALALGVLVVEAASRSGSLITAGMALEQGREVFAVPGFPEHPLSAGCNALLKQGAILVRSAQDVLEELAPVLRADLAEQQQPAEHKSGSSANQEREEDLSPEEQELTSHLQKRPQEHIDVLSAELGWESQKMSRVLMMLELKGVVKQLSGMYYSLC